MLVKYISVDLETTGLDPDRHQILEIGAIFDDTEDRTTPEKDLPRLRIVILPSIAGNGDITGSPEALIMNAGLIREIAEVRADPSKKRPGTIYCQPERVSETMALWLRELGFGKYPGFDGITAAGKNFAGFDRRFLEKVGVRFSHRSLDPTPFFLKPGDTGMPGMETCKQRAGLDGSVSHRALDDALDVVSLVRCAYRHPLFAPEAEPRER